MRKSWQARPTSPPKFFPRPKHLWIMFHVLHILGFAQAKPPQSRTQNVPVHYPKPGLSKWWPFYDHFNWDHVSPVSLYKFHWCLPFVYLFLGGGWGKKTNMIHPFEKNTEIIHQPRDLWHICAWCGWALGSQPAFRPVRTCIPGCLSWCHRFPSYLRRTTVQNVPMGIYMGIKPGNLMGRYVYDITIYNLDKIITYIYSVDIVVYIKTK